MAKNLVIVESPAKAKTIEKFLGNDFKVASSFGHISDLPSKDLGVDVEGDFKPKYEVSKDKKTVVKNLKDLANKSETIWLASDEDREGEAIAWHLFRLLNLKESNTKRIVFNEITKSAIQKAIDNPRSIDYNLVDAQQARRVLDRIVGYELSPVLWRKIKSGLSAGRVQSVSVRLIVEKEREIKGFNSESSYRIDAEFITKNGKNLKAKLEKTFDNKDNAQSFLKKNIGSSFSVESLEKKPLKKSPSAPFTTSTLQQEASRKLYFSVSKTMTVAQRLYESGLITYMRTDSVNLSNLAKDSAKDHIVKNYGNQYSSSKSYKTKSKGAQDAHEAIRPTDFSMIGDNIADNDQKRLYQLIWKRTIASQMTDASLEKTNVKIKSSNHEILFTSTGQVVKFDGFLKVYSEAKGDGVEEDNSILPKIDLNEDLKFTYIRANQRFSRPPFRYTEASLVKKLEDLGIGRPSTYAPTISTIQNRGYVEKGTVEGENRDYIQLILENNEISENTLQEKVGSDKGKLVPTDIGMIVTDFLINHFENIMDYNFTASVEEDFDNIADGKQEWTSMMKEFYKKFHPVVEDVSKNAERESGKRILGAHPENKKEVSVRLGKFGPMIQVGTVEDEEKPVFASLPPEMQIESVTLEEALDLFSLPRELGEYNNETLLANNGRYGPYVKYGKKFVSIPKGKSPLSISIEEAVELIKIKEKSEAPIYNYEGLDVQKGKGKFGPFIKWNNMFINVGKKYDWDNLSENDIIELIEDKKKKEKEKLIHNWAEENIRVEKGKWGKIYIIKGKIRKELSKTIDPKELSLDDAIKILDNKKE
ncbi:MAG: type I DNA topoisomerase [Flavobacteriales bacterium]|nr:MAG: type I DNA topoisomerase [Flavobacteriales bacterium]